MIAGSDALSPTKRAELRGAIRTKPGLARLLRTTPGGLAAQRCRGHQGRGAPRRHLPAALQ